MRTDKEIIERIEEMKERDWLGAGRGDLATVLPVETAQKLPGAGPDQTWEQKPRNAEAVKARMLEYMPFAWDKANNCRGISAGRSLDHMSAWLWLLGRDEAAKQMLDYEYYGKPWLRAICEEFGWDWRQWDDSCWRNDENSGATNPPERVEPLA